MPDQIKVSRRGFLGLFAAACEVPLIYKLPTFIIAPERRFFLAGNEWHQLEIMCPRVPGDNIRPIFSVSYKGEELMRSGSLDDDPDVFANFESVGRIDKPWLAEDDDLRGASHIIVGMTVMADEDIVGAELVAGGIRLHHYSKPWMSFQCTGAGEATMVCVDGQQALVDGSISNDRAQGAN